jgi:FKBP-type peptidyl-prolyl cis-trans isomerase FklB
MNRKILVLAILAIFISSFTVNAQKKKTVKMKTSMDSISYSIGSIFGSNLKNYGFKEINVKLFAKAIEDAIKGQDLAITSEKANELVRKTVTEMRQKKVETNLADGKAFLEKNKKEPGVIELPSGLQYKILKEGAGESPKAESKISANYKGTLIDGTVFETTENKEPVKFGVSDVIEGWKEALQLMKPGAKWKLFIPANLAYGENPQPGGPIEPNMVLIFEIELISIDQQ